MIRLLKFDPKRVSVSFAEDTCRTVAEPGRERRYTLTHNDLTRHLTLSVASDFNGGQTEIWRGRNTPDTTRRPPRPLLHSPHHSHARARAPLLHA